MKCFYHPHQDAVGTCKNCNKGLCVGCAADLGDGLACQGHCEDKVQDIMQMVRRGTQAYQKVDKQKHMQSLVFLAMGLTFGGMGLMSGLKMFYAPAAAMILFAIFNLRFKYAD